MEKIDFKKLNIRELIMMQVTLLALIGFVYYKLDYEPLEKKIKAADAQIKTLNDSLGILRQGIVSPEAVASLKKEAEKTTDENVRLRGEIAKLRAQMTGRGIDVLQQVKKEAELRGAGLLSFKTQENSVSRNGLSYKEVTVTLRIHSDYRSLISLIDSLDAIPAVLSVKSILIERKDKILPQVETALKLQLYVL